MNKALVSSVNFDILCRHSLSWRFPVLYSRRSREGRSEASLVCRVEERGLDMKAVFKWVEHPLSIFYGS